MPRRIKRGNKNELYGVNVFTEAIDSVEPDVVFIYNDLIVCSRLMVKLEEYYKTKTKNFKLFIYLDLVYEYERIELLELIIRNVDKLFVFTDFWKEHLIKMFPKLENVYTFYHGINTDKLSIEDYYSSRMICNIGKDDFVILNTNRNTYRKANDISITAFLKFLKKERISK